MKKRILFIIFTLLLCFSSSFTSFAHDNLLVQDFADLLDDSEEQALNQKLEKISEEYEADIVVLTTDDLEGYTPHDYCEAFFDYNGYGQGAQNSGILLLINIQERDWYICSFGFCMEAFDEDVIEDTGDEMLDSLSSGKYSNAFNIFADECEYRLNGHINGFPFPFLKSLIISLVIGLILAFIVTAVMRGQLKSVKAQHTASNYVKSGSMMLTDSRDFFIYRHISRIRKPQNNGGSRGSSSGRSCGGGGKY